MNRDSEFIRQDVPTNRTSDSRDQPVPRPSFWSYLLIGLGVLFLLENFGVLAGHIWNALWRFWPLVLLVAGIDLVFGRHSTLARGLTAILVGLSLGAILLWSIFPPSRSIKQENISQTLSVGTQQADIKIGIGVGRLRIAALDTPGALIDGTINHQSNQTLLPEFRQQGNTAYYKLEARDEVSNLVPFWSNNDDLRWDLRLAKSIPTKLRLLTGVGESNVDLADLEVRDLNFSAGVGKTTITMPRSGEVQAEISGGIGETIVHLPAGVAARIKGSSGIGSIDVQGDFQRSRDEYISPGYANAINRVNLQISSGIGRIAIESAR
jgi:Domain of unknown function (DUF5668)/Cell wall-active antibiotics response 4TMS YvqF